MSFNFRSKLDRWFGKHFGCSLLLFALVFCLSAKALAQEQSTDDSEASRVAELTIGEESSSDEESSTDDDSSTDKETLTQESVPLEDDSSVENSQLGESVSDNPALPVESREVDNSEYQRVVVAETFVNLMSGPGRGFPIFYVAEQKESIWILQRRNNWFKVRIAKSKEGWVHISDMQKMLNPDGSAVSFKELTDADFEQRSWELGFRAGDFEGAKILAVAGAWQATPNLSAEFVLGQGLGDFSETQQATVSVTNSPFPDWIVSPYFGIGAGVIRTIPSASLVQETDRQDEVLFATAGARTYITDRFLFRVDYRNYVVLTTQETNEEVEEWTVGFSVFF